MQTAHKIPLLTNVAWKFTFRMFCKLRFKFVYFRTKDGDSIFLRNLKVLNGQQNILCRFSANAYRLQGRSLILQ
jgi:hypothetical protein